MARRTSYSAGTLTVKVTESLTLDGRDYGGASSTTFSSIKNVTRRIETITVTEASIMAFSTVIGPGQYVPANIAYMRFTNLDDTNFITLTFANEDDDEFAVKLDAGKTFVLAGDNSGGMVDVIDAKDSALSYSLGDMKSVTADADTGSCDLEIYIAGTA